MPDPGMAIATWVWRSGLALQGGGVIRGSVEDLVKWEWSMTQVISECCQRGPYCFVFLSA